jgi:hypothetical protein
MLEGLKSAPYLKDKTTYLLVTLNKKYKSKNKTRFNRNTG